MNRKGFSLIELLGCLAILAIILVIGLYSARGTLATSLSNLSNVSENDIYNASKVYVLENRVTWEKDIDYEYTCLIVNDLVEKGYFDNEEVSKYQDRLIKIFRKIETKVVNNIKFVDSCD